MDGHRKDHAICHVCQKTFSSGSTRNRHLRLFHHEESKTTVHIKCPVCSEEEQISFRTHDLLVKHLEQIHSLDIKTSTYEFTTMEEFESWRAQSNRNVDYALHASITATNDIRWLYYNCNRSNYKGLVSHCVQRSKKTGGSIKINGMCPSRISVKISSSGINVKYIETHVGHEDELRSKHLTKDQQDMIAKKLLVGVTKERVLEEAKVITGHKIERINIINRADLGYIIRKFNIDKKRHADDMIAIALKVQEWNSGGENCVFLFKQIGESYPGLMIDDFALGFMNPNMERKMKEFKRIICIDGTHGTNARNWDLTIVLVKDENNLGFPVAFLLSNRMDQAIQIIFFSSMKTRLGEAIDADFIMSDDDIKYYNAWCQIMATDRKPRRLLCSWHVIKNWNVQGRNKLKTVEHKKEMKYKMREILKETDCTRFLKLKEEYFNYLEREGEHNFLKYLQNHYFQSEERIMMWAHCHRMNAGINTNMAIESLNKVIKYNKMKGKQNIRVEKLLDLLEELVNDKIWKKIIQKVRPDANSYQCRVTRQAHIKAEKIVEKVICLDSGEFKVYSSSVSEKFYTVSYNQLCDRDCRTLYCEKCKICIHRYKCECSEFAVKTALCKHIQAVALVEKRSESVSGPLVNSSDEDGELYISEPTLTNIRYQTEVENFVEENIKKQQSTVSIYSKEQRQIDHEQLCMKMSLLDDENFLKVRSLLGDFFKDVENIDAANMSRKRKIEKQLYYPSRK